MAKKAARAAKPTGKSARPATRKSTPARKTASRKPAARRSAPPARAAAAPAAVKAAKYVYSWGAGKADGNGTMKPLLGGKGANLAEMARIGLPVPAGFTISTEVCTHYYANKRTYPEALQAQIEAGIRKIERIMGYKFGDASRFPLLVAVRSGARDSMPGMMDTILNLGLNDETVIALERATNNPRFAWDCYRRFIQMYGDVVLGVQKRAGEDHEPFETVLETYKHEVHGNGHLEDTKLSADDLKEIIVRFKKLVKERTGKAFPADPWKQLDGAVSAVFGSWMNDRAISSGPGSPHLECAYVACTTFRTGSLRSLNEGWIERHPATDHDGRELSEPTVVRRPRIRHVPQG